MTERHYSLWKCNKCGATFTDKPLQHGDFRGDFVKGFTDVPCKGELVGVE